jgi:RHS repeat-associated protein
VIVNWPFGWTATQQQIFARTFWHGTLIEQKRDASGLLFRRNRYVDPATGRFTQEDPIGLAGGISAYGFAQGDPVNYSDPFGLCPKGYIESRGVCYNEVALLGLAVSGLFTTAEMGLHALGEAMHEAKLAMLGDNAIGERNAISANNRLEFQASPKHGGTATGRASAGPVNGQDALDVSVKVKSTSPRRGGIDYDANEFVVFDQTSPGVFHGHVRPWADLTQEMRNALIRAGMATRRGDIIQ